MLLPQMYKNYCQNAKWERLKLSFVGWKQEKSIEEDMKLRTINIKQDEHREENTNNSLTIEGSSISIC